MSRLPAIAWLVAAGLLVGCKDPQMDHLRAIRDDVCACKSSACADQAMARVPQTPVASTRRTQRVAREMLDCLAKLYEKTRPTTGPDETTPVAPR